jgi:hypothetical protein
MVARGNIEFAGSNENPRPVCKGFRKIPIGAFQWIRGRNELSQPRSCGEIQTSQLGCAGNGSMSLTTQFAKLEPAFRVSEKFCDLMRAGLLA